MSKDKSAPRRTYRVYVVELDDAAGSRLHPDRPCLYVGQTFRSPEERFEQHKRGYKASKWVRKYGLKLRPDLCPDGTQPTRPEAEVAEVERAKELEARGYRVFGGH